MLRRLWAILNLLFLWHLAFTESVRAADGTAALPKGVQALAELPGVHNLFLLGTNVYSGSTPENEPAFAALAKLGVRTIISVDGGKPDVATARKHGMRYVHLPHGYDGISTNLQRRLAKIAHMLEGPFYVHCHHGRHRGPAAAAVLCMAKDGWSHSQSERWLQAAGTATNYSGLYEAVRTFRKPSATELAQMQNDFPSVARVSGLVEAMVAIDARWERLKAVRASGYRPPPGHPDVDPAHEAVLLWEDYRESQRLADAIRLGDDFIARLKKSESEVKEAERLLRLFSAGAIAQRPALDTAFTAISRSCASCHTKYRDPANR